MPMTPTLIANLPDGDAVDHSASSDLDYTPLVTTVEIPAGRVVTIATNRGASTTSTSGISAVSVAGVNVTLRRLADAGRVSASDVSLVAFETTATVPVGTEIRVVHRTTTAGKRGAVACMWPAGLTLPPVADATSGNTNDGQLGDTSRGPNGNGTVVNATTTAATTAGSRLLLGAVAVGGTNTFTEAEGWVRIGESRTKSGTSDRGVVMAYRLDETPAVKSFGGTMSSSTSWAAGVAALAGTFAVSAPQLTVVSSSHVLIEASSTTSGAALAITQTGGPATTPVQLSPGVWLVARHATDPRAFNVTATLDGLTRTSPVSVPSAGVTSDNARIRTLTSGGWA